VSAAFHAFNMILPSLNKRRQLQAAATKPLAYVPIRRNVKVVSGVITSPFISSRG
jgi:hypothetical protein